MTTKTETKLTETEKAAHKAQLPTLEAELALAEARLCRADAAHHAEGNPLTRAWLINSRASYNLALDRVVRTRRWAGLDS